MKKLWSLLLVAVLLLSCYGCKGINSALEGQETADVFPQGVQICGVDVSGMTAAEAESAMQESVKNYILTLSLDGTVIPVTAEELALSCTGTDYETILQSCLEDPEKKQIVVENLISFDLAKLEEKLKAQDSGETAAKSAYIKYEETEQSFVIVPEEQGSGINLDAVLAAVKEAVSMLQPKLELDRETAYQPAEHTAQSQEVKDALEKANKILNTELEYTYAPEGAEPATEKIDKTLIASWLVVEEDGLSVEIDPGPLNEYIGQMDEAHSIKSSTSKFKTTGGNYINIRVPSAGQTVDTDALYNDIFDCLTNGISGKRDAPYVKQEENTGANFGGNYVEIDLSSQHLWVYNGGSCVVSTDIVSGCVNSGHATPGGLYTIQSKETDRYLTGPGYKSWVNFWMPFNGGIGLHDASWRGSFGGSIYYYSGSHGCINMPYSAAQTTYRNISVGTHVILYGGTTSVSPLSNSLSGTGSYTVEETDGSFTLDTKAAVSTTLSYSSSDSSVVTVSSSGVVTIVGPGTATITVKAESTTGYTSTTKTITITVKSKCQGGEHSWDDGKVTTAPTCAAHGVKTYTCTRCGASKTEELPMTEHSWDGGKVTTASTCAAHGVKTYTCTSCGATKTEELPLSDHSWNGGEVIKEPTCVAGEKLYSCTICGTTRTETLAPAQAHHFENGACTVCGTVDPNYVPPTKPDPEPGEGA